MSTYKSVLTHKAYRNVNSQSFVNGMHERPVTTKLPLFASGRGLRRKAYVVALEFTPLQSSSGAVENLLNRWAPTRRFVYARHRQFLQNASRVIVGSNETAESLRNDYQVDKSRIVTIL